MATKISKINGGRIRKVTITEIENEEVINLKKIFLATEAFFNIMVTLLILFQLSRNGIGQIQVVSKKLILKNLKKL